MSRQSLPSSYEKLQASISDRARWATIAEREITANFEEWGSCQASYETTFKSAKEVGAGTYGVVYKTFLKNNRYPYPIAVKRTLGQEIEEAKRMVLVSSIAEAGFNPHFTMLYSHFHCEEMKSRVRTGLSYLESVPVIKQLQQRHQELAAISNKSADLLAVYEDIPRQINTIIKERVPTVEEINWITGVKHALATKLGTLLESPSIATPSSIESISILQTTNPNGNELAMFKVADYLFKEMLNRRQEIGQVKPYEFISQEFIDGQTLFDWIKSKPPQRAIISCIFQVCMAILSLLSYFGIVQNDLNMNNIMYNNVPKHTTYSYRVGDVVYSVPLHGKLFKIIDFGLATTVNHKPYCVGNDWFQKCTGFNRDFLEFFYKVSIQYVYYVGSDIGKWTSYAYNLFLSKAPNSVDDVVEIIHNIFSADTMKKYELIPIKISTPSTSDTFEVIANPDRRKKVMNIALQKKYIENVK